MRGRGASPACTAALLATFLFPALAAADQTPDLALPASAIRTQERIVPLGGLPLPVGPWQDGRMPTLSLSGAITERSWRLPDSGTSTFALMTGLSQTLAAQGYAPIYACVTDDCGGFDFRYKLKLMPEPAMHVDLGDFRYLAAIRGRGEGADYVGLIVSRMGDTGFVQLIHVGRGTEIAGGSQRPGAGLDTDTATPAPAVATAAQTTAADAPPPVGEALTREGHVVLPGLDFATGAADLTPGDHPALVALANYLRAHANMNVIIVGHTDVSGTLSANIALSERRARAVKDELIRSYGVPAGQLSAEGAGPLAPVASNLTDEGRAKNRRVEAVLASTR